MSISPPVGSEKCGELAKVLHCFSFRSLHQFFSFADPPLVGKNKFLLFSPNPNKNRSIVSIISASRAVVLDPDLIPNAWPAKGFGGSGLVYFLLASSQKL
jgi:hypothetical protein